MSTDFTIFSLKTRRTGTVKSFSRDVTCLTARAAIKTRENMACTTSVCTIIWVDIGLQ